MKKVVLNDRKDGNWGSEEIKPLIIMQDDSASKIFNPGHTAQILIESEVAHLKVILVFIYGTYTNTLS